jgi:hypothetical protein
VRVEVSAVPPLRDETAQGWGTLSGAITKDGPPATSDEHVADCVIATSISSYDHPRSQAGFCAAAFLFRV